MKGGRNKIDFIAPVCLECGRLATMTSGARIFRDRPDLANKMFFVCACGARVGCHPNSAIPLGRPAGPETRRLRKVAHDLFDPIWRGDRHRGGVASGHARIKAYRWLARELDLKVTETHFGNFDSPTLRQVIQLCREWHARRSAA